MEIKISTKQYLKILYVISWIIFIGVCIDAGGFLFNTFYTLVLNPINAKYFWNELDLSSLYNFDRGHFFAAVSLINIVVILKAIMVYVIVKFQYNKKLDISKPFNESMVRFIRTISFLAAAISVFSIWGTNYSDWLITKGVKLPALQYLRLAGADVWLFMGVILSAIALLFKRGIEIQSENDLTV